MVFDSDDDLLSLWPEMAQKYYMYARKQRANLLLTKNKIKIKMFFQ